MAYGTNAPFGLRPLQSITGGSWTEKTNVYSIYADPTGQTTYKNSLFTGDPVVWSKTANQTGTIMAFPVTASSGDAPVTPVLGVFMGCEYFDSRNQLVKSPYWPGAALVYPGSRIKAWVIDDPLVVYDVQVSTSTDVATDPVFPSTNFGQNFTLTTGPSANKTVMNPSSGNTLTGQSVYYLDATTRDAGALATLAVQAIGYTENPTQPTGGTGTPYTPYTLSTMPYVNVRVIINNHAFKVGNLGAVPA